MTSLTEQVCFPQMSQGVDCSISTSSSALPAEKGAVTLVNILSGWSETLGATSELSNQREARLHEDCLTPKLA